MKNYLLTAGKVAKILALSLISVVGHAQEITILQVAPFGGNLAASARDYNLGALLAADEVNALGGVAGQKIKLISRDDGNNPENTLNHVLEVVEKDSPSALIGLWGDEAVDKLLQNPVFKKSAIPIVGVRSGSVALRNQRQLFNVRSSYRDEVDGMLKQLSVMAMSKIAILYEDNLFGRDTYAYADEVIKKNGFNLINAVTHKSGNLDMSAAVDSLSKLAPQAILVFSNTNSAAAFVKGYREKVDHSLIMATSTVEASVLTKQVGAKAARGIAVAQSVPNPQKSSIVAMQLRNKMSSINISLDRASFSTLEGYIAMKTVIEAIKRSDKGFKPDQLKSSLEKMARVDLGGFTVDFSPEKHDGSKFVELSIISESGRLLQ